MSVIPQVVLDLEKRGLLHNGVPKLDPKLMREDALLHAEIQRREELKKDTVPVLAALPDGTGIVAPRWVVEEEKRRIGKQLAMERFIKTGQNIAGGPGGAVGYLVGGDEGSDKGAVIDQMSMIFAPHPLNTQEVVREPLRQMSIPIAELPNRTSPIKPEEPGAPRAQKHAPPPTGPRSSGSRAQGTAGRETEIGQQGITGGPPEGRIPVKPSASPPEESDSRATGSRLVPVVPKRPLPKAKSPAAESNTESARAIPQQEESERAPRRIQMPSATADKAKPAEKRSMTSSPPRERSPEAQTGESAQALPTKGTKRPPGASEGGKLKKREAVPSPHELEQEVTQAVKRDEVTRAAERRARGLAPAETVIFENTSFEKIVEQLRRLDEVHRGTANAPTLKRLSRLDKNGQSEVDKLLRMGPSEFWDRLAEQGNPMLKRKFEELQKWTETRPAAREELVDFLSHGRVGARRPDTAVLRLRPSSGAIEMSVSSVESEKLVSATDPTRITTLDKAVVHEFKTLFYIEVFREILDLPVESTESFEHNPVLGVHRPAMSRDLPKKEQK